MRARTLCLNSLPGAGVVSTHKFLLKNDQMDEWVKEQPRKRVLWSFPFCDMNSGQSVVRTRHEPGSLSPQTVLLMRTGANFTQGGFCILFTACFRYRVASSASWQGLKDRILKGCLNPTAKLLEPGMCPQELDTIFFYQEWAKLRSQWGEFSQGKNVRELRYLFLRRRGGVGKGCQLWKDSRLHQTRRILRCSETRGASADQVRRRTGWGGGGWRRRWAS